MAYLQIEMDRGNGWEARHYGAADVTAEQVLEQLPAYAVKYRHRALLDGKVIGEAVPVRGRRLGRLVSA